MAVITNLTRGTVVAAHAATARNPWTRFLGLMGRSHLPSGAALVFPNAQGVHTHFMRFPIDLVFYGRDLVVLDVVESLPPWRFSPYRFRAKGVIELPAGAARASGTRPGDLLAISDDPTP